MKYLIKSVKIMIIILLPIFILFTSVEQVAYDVDFYNNNFKENEIYEKTGYSKTDLNYVSENIIDYIKGDRNDFDIKLKGGSLFNKKEIYHMNDVIKLFDSGRIIKWVVFFILILSIGTLYFFRKEDISKVFIKTSIFSIAALTILAVGIVTSFDVLFEKFHLMLFSNDLWLLDPDTDFLINILTEDFFLKMAIKILIYFLIKVFILAIVGIIIERLSKFKYKEAD